MQESLFKAGCHFTRQAAGEQPRMQTNTGSIARQAGFSISRSCYTSLFCVPASSMTQDFSPDDDLDLFRQAVQGAKRLKHDQAEVGKAPRDRASIAASRQRATLKDSAVVVDGLSDQFVIDVDPEQELAWASNGVQDAQLRKLKQAQIPFDGSIDLHGMTIERARELLWAFLAEAVKQEIRCVRVTHGKARRLDGRKPLMKSHVNTWLRQHDKVLAFSSCIPRHGGTGSVYVLLRRNMLEGRDD